MVEDVTIQTSADEENKDDLFNPNRDLTLEESDEETESAEETPPQDTEDYKQKFSMSSQENQRILAENKKLQLDMASQRAEADKLKVETKRYADLLLNENPEAMDMAQTRQAVAQLQKDIALEREARKLDDFVREHPEAQSHREALQRFGRVYPEAGYESLWSENFAPLIAKGEETSAEQIRKARKSSPETGKGSASGAPSEGGMTPEQFSKLSIEEKKAHLKKIGLGTGDIRV